MEEADGRGPALEVKGVSVNFGEVQALIDVSLRVDRGEILGVVGTNGAGKSTLIDVLSGMVKPSSGQVRVLGKDPVRQARDVRRRMGVVPQETSIEEKLSAWENLRYFGRLLDVPEVELNARVEEMVRFMDLWDRRHDKMESYSVGMKRKVHFACSLMHGPEVVLVDEATSGFDPAAKREVNRLIVEMSRQRGITVLLTTHDLSDARSICDRLAVLHRGRLVAAGSWDELTSGRESKVIIAGVSPADGERLRGLLQADLTETIGGYELQASSPVRAMQLATVLEEHGIAASSISFEVPASDVFDDLTSGSGGGARGTQA